MENEAFAVALFAYIVFLFSTVCHEAAHALAAKLGGDLTAYHGGQVDLNPIPHIRREPFGLGVLPLLTLLLSLKSGGIGVFGYASAPFNVRWAIEYPKRAAWMAMAGPAANFTLAILAGISMRVGVALGFFTGQGGMPDWQVVGPLSGSLAEPLSILLSLFFFLNLMLGFFNLFPIPPLDGFSMLLFIVPKRYVVKIFQFRQKFGFFALLLIFGISNMFWEYFWPVYSVLRKIAAPV
jgi:Zn-dependent protease